MHRYTIPLPFGLSICMARNYKNYTDQDVINFSKDVKSLSQLLKKLNLRSCGGNYANMKLILQRLEVDCSHWTGQAWSKGQQLKPWNKYLKNQNLKNHIIKEREKECESCKLQVWMSFSIPLELHHINGDRTDNTLENLQLLCPNCHALTSNWRNRKMVG